MSLGFFYVISYGMKNIGLKELIYPITEVEFFKKNWPESALFIPPTVGKLSEILNLPQLQSLEALTAARTLKVRACLPDFDDEYSSIHLDPKDAIKAYDNNMTLVFDSMQTQENTIAQMLKNLTLQLGLVIGTADQNLCQARSIVYATPEWCGTRLHFDANANFIIQISGSKKWKIIKNNSVNYPTERFTTGSVEMPMALEKQCHAELLTDLPDDATEYIMTPGTVLFVPRGYWHETTTDQDSLSLNFTFSQPSWADVFSKSIHEVLLSSPEWRKLYMGVDSNNLLLNNLIEKLQKISTTDLLTEGGFFPESKKI